MRTTFLICCFLAATSLLNAQRLYFVYLQTETGEQFFIRMNDKLYSSTEAGYLILPRLIDSTYNFKLGFQGKNVDLDFTTSINKRDHGYLIKNFGEKGWGLFDLQSLSIQMASGGNKSTFQINNNPTQEVNAFTDMLSKATDDPSLKQNAILVKGDDKKQEAVDAVVKEEKKPEGNSEKKTIEKKPGAGSKDSSGIKGSEVVSRDNKNEKKPNDIQQVKVVEKKPVGGSKDSSGIKGSVVVSRDNKHEKKPGTITQDPTVIKKQDTLSVKVPDQVVVEKKPEVQKEEPYKKSVITKVSGISGPDGFETVFVDRSPDGSEDTIRILIPAGANATASENINPGSKQDDKKFLDISPDTTMTANNTQTVLKEEKKEPVKTQAVVTPIKNTCKSVAINDDFLKLRRKMAAKTNDDGMIDEAKKYFKAKCFTTEQLKNLSTMFLSSAGKYNFFDAAYDHVSDQEHFASLESELKDETYVNRFRKILRN